jgi:hypothetical protein
MPTGTGITAYTGVLMPSQLFGGRNVSLQPERRLLLAVLDDAVQVWRKVGSHDGPRGRRLRTELVEWFSSDTMESPFAFASICASFGIDPTWARMRLGVPRPVGETAIAVASTMNVPLAAAC